MKPIEIHIEGYKIVISEDKEPEVSKEPESIKYVPYPVYPSIDPNLEWWKPKWGDVIYTNKTDISYPPVERTVTAGYGRQYVNEYDVVSNIQDQKIETPVRDAMVGASKS